jgi:hypothetical protein
MGKWGGGTILLNWQSISRTICHCYATMAGIQNVRLPHRFMHWKASTGRETGRTMLTQHRGLAALHCVQLQGSEIRVNTADVSLGSGAAHWMKGMFYVTYNVQCLAVTVQGTYVYTYKMSLLCVMRGDWRLLRNIFVNIYIYIYMCVCASSKRTSIASCIHTYRR